MPTPNVPNVIRAQVVLQGSTDLPEDRMINTFHFETAAGIPPQVGHFDAIANRLTNFYNGLGGPENLALSSWIPPVVRRSALTHFRMYHLGDAEPRPVHTRPFALGTAGVGDALPSELSVALSYFGPSNTPGRRGRIYIGPLNVFALAPAVGLEERRVALSLRQTIGDAAARLAQNPPDELAPNTVRWIVLSQGRRAVIDTPEGRRARGELLAPARYQVTGGWVDNAFDIQRRRGMKANSRHSWTELA